MAKNQHKTKILETSKGKNTFMVDPRNIEVKDDFNGRKFFDPNAMDLLKQSIKENGVITPIELKKIRGTDKYHLIDGERRWRASMELVNEGFEMRIPSIMFEGNDVDAVVHMLIKNDNEGLSFVEEAEVIKRLKGLGLNDKEIIQKTGRKKAYLLSLERILTAPESIKKLIGEKRISHTLVLEKITDNNLDPEQAFAAIKQLAETGGSKKVTKKSLDAKIGQTDSIKELKAVMKLVEGKEREFLDGPEDELLITFLQKLVGNKLTREKLEKLLLKPDLFTNL